MVLLSYLLSITFSRNILSLNAPLLILLVLAIFIISSRVVCSNSPSAFITSSISANSSTLSLPLASSTS